MGSINNGKKPHAIMIPFPYQGHINPSTNLALKLASKGIAVTFVQFEFYHHALCQVHHVGDTNGFDIFSEARQSGLDIRYKVIDDGFPLEFDRNLHLVEYCESLLQSFQSRVDEFVKETISSDPSLAHFLMVDTNFAWLPAIARKYNLVSVSFWTEAAAVFSLLYHLDLLKENGHYPCKDDLEEEIDYVPGVQSLNTRDLMPYLKESEIGSIANKVMTRAFEDIEHVDFVLQNTIQELESETLSALEKNQPHYSIGPVKFFKNLAKTTIKNCLWSESDCTDWLQSKSPGSVLYVSFGSMVPASKKAVEETAQGLQLSGVNFIWVIRGDNLSSTDTKVFMDEFKNEVGNKGLIVPWCDQVAVLSDPAVGGFLTHCGWNSVMDSMWYGVPMICYPLTYDQMVNRKLVVDDWKIGMNLCDGIIIDREEVARKIRRLMSGSGSEGLRQELKKVNGTVRNAVQVDGSSERNIDQFVHDLRAKVDATASHDQNS